MKLVDEFPKRVKELTIQYAVDPTAREMSQVDLQKLIEGQSCMALAKEIHRCGYLNRAELTDKDGAVKYTSMLLVISPLDYAWMMRSLKDIKTSSIIGAR